MSFRAENRNERNKAIQRKLHIIKDTWHTTSGIVGGSLSKGKIHCSCWMCSYNPSSGILSDIRKKSRQIYESKEEGYIPRHNTRYNRYIKKYA